MPVKVECLSPEPIIQATFYPPFDLDSDTPILLAGVKQCRERLAQSCVVILDVSAIQVNFSEIVFALSAGARQIHEMRANHAILPTQYIFVGSGDIVGIAAQAMGQDQYGGIGGQMCASMDEALAYARDCCARVRED